MMHSGRVRRGVAALAVMSLLGLAGCGDDDSAGPAGSGGGGERVEFTLTSDRIEGPEEIEGGVVEVTISTELDGADVSFTKVPDGTSEQDFKEAVSKALGGQGLSEVFGATAGLSGSEGSFTETIELPAGAYFVWSLPEGPPGDDDGGDGPADGPEGEGEGEGGPGGGGGPPPEAVVLTALTVTEGAGELPERDGGSIVAKDYTFDIDVEAGESFTFRNDGPEEYHHVVLFDFGDLDADVVEENLPAFFESGEDGPPPAAFKDLDMENLEAGNSGVFSPGLGGTFSAELEGGTTYAAVCFISDKSGGPPHAFAHKMIKVFAVE